MDGNPWFATAMTVLVLALAGCSGTYEVDQTEPLRIQLDGPAETVNVSEANQPQRVVIENPEKVEQIEVTVDVRTESDDPVVVEVVVRDGDTDEELANKTLSSGNTTAGGNVTEPPTENMTTNIVVQGHHNIIVLAQAQQGTADVDISAKGVKGNQTVA